MIKEAIQYLIDEVAPKEMFRVDGRPYTTRKINLITAPTMRPIETESLKSIISYLKNNCDNTEENNIIIHIKNETTVDVYSEGTEEMERHHFLHVKAPQSNICFSCFLEPSEFIIQTQSKFQPTDDSKYLLSIAGNITSEAIKNVGDSGIAQQVTVKQQISLKNEVLKPIVILKPYRTFREVEQPESSFLLRVKDGPSMAIFEADGGTWKIEARDNIKEYLEQNLKDVTDIKVTILS